VLLHDQWLCSPECFVQVLQELLLPLIQSARANRETKTHRFPLGLLMHSLGLISKESLLAALQAQREAGVGRVGDWLRRQGAVTEPQVTQALAAQWALPIYPLEKREGSLNWAHLLPVALLESFQMLPVHCTPALGLLHVAFSGRVDYTALYAIEQMLQYRTEPCMALESSIEKALARLHQEGYSTDIPIVGPMEPSIISSTTLQQALKFGPQEVRVVGCADNIWVRLHAPPRVRDLLFHRAADQNTLYARHGSLKADEERQDSIRKLTDK
jgi:hypothetical protein